MGLRSTSASAHQGRHDEFHGTRVGMKPPRGESCQVLPVNPANVPWK